MTRWPGGAQGAVAFTFDFDAEEVWIGDDPANADRPGVLSQGTYGAKVAVPLILELLERHGPAPDVLHARPRRRALPGAGAGDPGRRPRGRPPRLHPHLAREPRPPRRRRPSSRARSRCCAALGADPIGLPLAVVGVLAGHDPAAPASTASPTRPTTWTTCAPTHTRAATWSSCRSSGCSTMRRTSGSRAARTGRARSRRPRTCARSGRRARRIVKLGGSCILTMHPQIIGRPHRLKFLEEFIAEVQGPRRRVDRLLRARSRAWARDR